MTLIKPALLAMAVPLVFAGCASTNPKPAFNNMNQTVTARLGETVQWPAGNSSDEQMTQAVDSLLKTNLTAQSVTAIALLNNRSVRADFEQIGISQADLAQASRLPNIELAGSWRFPDRPPSAVDVEYSAAGNFLDLLTLPARKKNRRAQSGANQTGSRRQSAATGGGDANGVLHVASADGIDQPAGHDC